jgi:sialate O-acetylesterase
MSELTLGFPFSEGLVLQRGQAHRIWGHDRPGEQVSLLVERAEEAPPRQVRFVQTLCDVDGRFELSCPALPPGGPYRFVVQGSRSITLADVLVGEVWVASGQSNMEWPLSATENADAEVESAEDPCLRVLKVERQTSLEPLVSAQGVWVRSTPDTAGSFTAVGYYFAKELRAKLGVPLGIIDCTWGGSPIAAWMSKSALDSVDESALEKLEALRKELPNVPVLRAEYQQTLSNWEGDSFPQDPPNTGVEKGYHLLEFDDGDWKSIKLPAFWQHHGMRFNGVVWFRRIVEVPPAFLGQDLTLSLGAIDDFDHTYFNGELVGAHPAGTPEAFQIQRRYTIPAHLVRPGKNVIAVRVFDHFGEGGFAGPARALRIFPVTQPEQFLSLIGEWRLFAEHPIPLVPASVFASYPAPPLLLTPQYIPSALFCGMLAPVVPYGVRGFLWYQGESDVENYERYEADQRAFVLDLRARFCREDAPFLFVELAGYRGGPSWPHFRSVQQRAANQTGTALVTARDIGDADDIHPRNKKEVGRRLSLVARSLVYGEDMEVSGPQFERAERVGQRVRVHFRSRSPLCLREGEPAGFELSGEDGEFVTARAVVSERFVEVESADVRVPRFVRYAFTDTGEGGLENASGLPAFSFCAEIVPA